MLVKTKETGTRTAVQAPKDGSGIPGQHLDGLLSTHAFKSFACSFEIKTMYHLLLARSNKAGESCIGQE